MTHPKLTPPASGRKSGWDPLDELELRAIRHAAYLDRLAGYGHRRPVLQLSAEFLLDVSTVLRQLVSARRRAA